ncbi:MAG: DUF11 domain-containing protein, partial [bacterium]|nr:DUF11 domain-containing protein [bacterium]
NVTLMTWPSTEARWQISTPIGRPSKYTGFQVSGDTVVFNMSGGTVDKPLDFQLVLAGESLSVGDRSVKGISRRYIVDAHAQALEYVNIESYVRPGSSLSGCTLLTPNFLGTPYGMLMSVSGSKWLDSGAAFSGLGTPSFRGRNWAGEPVWYGIGENRSGEYYLSWTRMDTGYRTGRSSLPAQLWLLDDGGNSADRVRQAEDALRTRWEGQMGLARQFLGDAFQIDIQGTLYNGSNPSKDLYAMADRYLKPALANGQANPDFIGSYGYKIVFIEPWLYYNNRSCHPVMYEVPPWIGGEAGLRYFAATAHAAGIKVVAWMAPAGIYGYSSLRNWQDWMVEKSDGSTERSLWFGRDAYSLSRGYPFGGTVGRSTVTWGQTPLAPPSSVSASALQASPGFAAGSTLSYKVTTSGNRGDSTPVTVSLKMPAVGGPYAARIIWGQVSGAAGYRIYRQDPASQRYYLLSEIVGGGVTSFTDNNSGKLTPDYEPLSFNNAFVDKTSGSWNGFYDYMLERMKYFAFKDGSGKITGIDGYYFDSALVMNEGNNDDWYYRRRDASQPMALTEAFYWAMARELQNYGLLYSQEVDLGIGPHWEHNPSLVVGAADFYAHYGQAKFFSSNPNWRDAATASRRKGMSAFVDRYGSPVTTAYMGSGDTAGYYWLFADRIWRRYTDGTVYGAASGEPQITVNKTVDKAQAASGDVLTYTLTYRNAGTQPAVSVEIRDSLQPGLRYVPGSAGTGNYDSAAGIVKWLLPRVEPGTGGTLSFKAVLE